LSWSLLYEWRVPSSAHRDPAVAHDGGGCPLSLGATLKHDGPGGFIVELGDVVDDAIIDVENIVRRPGDRLTATAARSLASIDAPSRCAAIGQRR